MSLNAPQQNDHLLDSETNLNRLFEKAQNELNDLCSENAIQSLLDQELINENTDYSNKSEQDKVLQLELGRVCCSAEQIASFSPGTIISLRQNEKGTVQLFHNDCLLAVGKLIVIDGKLAVQILTKEN